jgi:signal transduction histidine kinase
MTDLQPPSGSDSFPPSRQPPSGRARVAAALGRYVTVRTALPVAVGLALICGVIDFLTGDDLTTNFLYQIPVFVGAWFKRWVGAGSAMAVAAAGRVVTMSCAAGMRYGPLTIAWNTLSESVAFAFFALFVIALRSRADEARSRLVATTEQLRHAERLTTLGKLSAGVAHELGTPLHTIALRAEIIAGGTLEKEQAVKSARSILAQCERMTTILRQLLSFGRKGTAGARARADLRIAAREAAELVRPIARKKPVEIRLEEGKEPVWAVFNMAEIEQVIGNLVMNAAQASPPGSEVWVRSGQRSAREGEGEGIVAFVEVEDRGSGIAPEDLPHVFDPFFTTKEVGEGTGLGLSVSFGIVNDHGGRIDVQSAPNEGSKFTVLLPA